MKTTIKTLFILLGLAVFSVGNSQTTVVELSYLKMERGKWDNLTEIREVMREYNQARLDAGMIIAWELYRRTNTGAADPYDFIAVSVYEDYKKTENTTHWEWINENYTKEEQNEFMAKNRETWATVKMETYFKITGVENRVETEYLMFHRLSLKDGMGKEYKTFLEEVSKPIFEETITAGVRGNWSAWSKFLAEDDFQIVLVDEYAEYGQWIESSEPTLEAFKKVHPDLDIEETGEKLNTMRSFETSELWKLIDIIIAPPEE